MSISQFAVDNMKSFGAVVAFYRFRGGKFDPHLTCGRLLLQLHLQLRCDATTRIIPIYFSVGATQE